MGLPATQYQTKDDAAKITILVWPFQRFFSSSVSLSICRLEVLDAPRT